MNTSTLSTRPFEWIVLRHDGRDYTRWQHLLTHQCGIHVLIPGLEHTINEQRAAEILEDLNNAYIQMPGKDITGRPTWRWCSQRKQFDQFETWRVTLIHTTGVWFPVPLFEKLQTAQKACDILQLLPGRRT